MQIRLDIVRPQQHLLERTMTASPKKIALIYDFDGTLAPGNMHEHSFLPKLNTSADQFWRDVKARTRKHNADEILVYMWRMLELAREQNQVVTKSSLKSTELDSGYSVASRRGLTELTFTPQSAS